jgi:hypothetical protein
VPKVFVRCGYPLTAQKIKDEVITQEQKDAIITMLKAFDMSYGEADLAAFGVTSIGTETYDKVLHTLSMAVLEQKSWGGRDRKIYVNPVPEYLNLICYVENKRVVKTGIYTPGSGRYRGYDEDWEYEPAYLSGEKTHVILKLYVDDYGTDLPVGRVFEIEQCNVEKITYDESYIPTTYLTTLYETK